MVRKPAPPAPDCRTCKGSGEDAYGQRCVCTYNKDRAATDARVALVEIGLEEKRAA